MVVMATASCKFPKYVKHAIEVMVSCKISRAERAKMLYSSKMMKNVKQIHYTNKLKLGRRAFSQCLEPNKECVSGLSLVTQWLVLCQDLQQRDVAIWFQASLVMLVLVKNSISCLNFIVNLLKFWLQLC